MQDNKNVYTEKMLSLHETDGWTRQCIEIESKSKHLKC